MSIKKAGCIFMLFLFLFMPFRILADDTTKILLYGKPVTITPPPIIENGTILVPLLETSQLFGADVKKETTALASIIKGSHQYIFYNNDKKYLTYTHDNTAPVSFKENTLVMAPVQRSGTTYILLNDFAKLFHIYSYYYNPKTNTLNIGLYEIDGKGNFEGWKMIKGHKLENFYEFYYKDNLAGGIEFKANSITENLEDTLTFVYNEKEYTIPRGALYRFFKKNSNNYEAFEKQMGIKNADWKDSDTNEALLGDYYNQWCDYADGPAAVYDYYNLYSNQKNYLNQDVKNADYFDLDYFLQQQSAQSNQEEIEKDIRTYREKLSNDHHKMVNNSSGGFYSEWMTAPKLYRYFDIGVIGSDSKKFFMDIYKGNKKVLELPYPQPKINPENEEEFIPEEIDTEEGGLRMKSIYSRGGMKFLLNIYDLADLGLIKREDINMIPDLVTYTNTHLETYIKEKYPFLNPEDYFIHEINFDKVHKWYDEEYEK